MFLHHSPSICPKVGFILEASLPYILHIHSISIISPPSLPPWQKQSSPLIQPKPLNHLCSPLLPCLIPCLKSSKNNIQMKIIAVYNIISGRVHAECRVKIRSGHTSGQLFFDCALQLGLKSKFWGRPCWPRG